MVDELAAPLALHALAREGTGGVTSMIGSGGARRSVAWDSLADRLPSRYAVLICLAMSSEVVDPPYHEFDDLDILSVARSTADLALNVNASRMGPPGPFEQKSGICAAPQ